MYILSKYSVDDRQTTIIEVIDDVSTNGFTKVYDKLITDLEETDDSYYSKKIISNKRVEVYEKSLIWPNRLVEIYQIIQWPEPITITKKEIEDIKEELQKNIHVFEFGRKNKKN